MNSIVHAGIKIFSAPGGRKITTKVFGKAGSAETGSPGNHRARLKGNNSERVVLKFQLNKSGFVFCFRF